MDDRSSPDLLRTALFVDFDNIYLGLRQMDSATAEEFATNPGRWLAWLERLQPGTELGLDAAPRRRILLRNCYLNPRSFSRYRADFSRAAFRVVDCPPITRQGKTSTDIHMVMDILDTLGHSTRFDEFILMSADADFTPVLFRLRHHDRRTLVVSVGPSSLAYRNAADILIGEEEFVSSALGGWRGEPPIVPHALGEEDDALFDEMADALVSIADTTERIEPVAMPRVYLRFTAFRESTDWLGHWSLKGLTESLVARRPEALRVVENGDDWWVERVTHLRPEGEEEDTRPHVSDDALAEEITEAVTELVRGSATPVPMASAAQHVLGVIGHRAADSNWAGAGSFKALLAERRGDLVLTQLTPTRWVILDPERHEVPEDADAVAGATPLARIARRVSRNTSVPPLTPEQYTSLFDALAEHLEEQPFDLTNASKGVRDRLVEAGVPVSRTSISFVLRGLTFAGHDFEDDANNDAASLARDFRHQVRTLCEDADLHLTEEEEALVDEWITSP